MMWPFGHAALGYLLYVAYRRYRGGGAPSGPAAIAVVVGTQVPDLVDKPLAWTFGVLATGRSLAHSWLLAGLVLVAAWWLLSEPRRSLVVPLGVGWFSHGLGDGVYSIVTWEPLYLRFLLWPVTATPAAAYETDQSFYAHLVGFEMDWYFGLQVVLVAVAFVVWRADRYPGIGTVYDLFRPEPAEERNQPD